MHATDSSGGRNANLRIGQTFPHLTSDTERDAVADDDTGRAPWYHSQCYSKPKTAAMDIARCFMASPLKMFSPGIFWSGLSLNRSGWEVQHLQMYS